MKTTHLTETLYQYLLDIAAPEDPVLTSLREYTSTLPLARMQISPLQGKFMQWLLQLIQAKNVLELGTFTGYSALTFALALPEDGHVITCDINPEWTKDTHRFWSAANKTSQIELRLGPALETLDALLPTHRAHFDFIFIDADKTHYLAYYERALQLLAPHGIIAIDNTLWSGKVADATVTDGQTRAIRELNAHIKADPRVHATLLPIADGLYLIQHRKDPLHER